MNLNFNEENTCCFRIYSNFEADNENDISCKGDKTTSLYKQNPV